LLRAAGCRSALIRDVRHRAVAEIFLEAHPDAAGLRVAVVRRDESGRALPPDAFLEARRVDSDMRRKAGRAEKGIAGPAAVVIRQDAPLPELWAQFQRKLPLPDAAPVALLVAEVLPRERRPAERAQSDALGEQRRDALSDAQLPVLPKAQLPLDAAERRASDLLLALQLVERARQAPLAEAQVPAPLLASRLLPERAPQPEQDAQSSLSPRRSSPPPPQLPPQQGPENVFAPAPHARYRSSSSASSFPGRRSSAKSRSGLWP
jgi:hypothetical protein